MPDLACCTCAALLSSLLPRYDEKSEKPEYHPTRTSGCCGRIVCTDCIDANPRFATYCPFCQISVIPSSLPQGLRDPPAYSPPCSPSPTHAANFTPGDDCSTDPPPYTTIESISPPEESLRSSPPAPDVLHFVDHTHDTVASLSLRYAVPAPVLRQTNNLYADHLLAARRTLVVPGSHYKGGVSLSPRPIGGEEEELRKAKIRRWMVRCKVSDYVVAVMYMKQSDYDLELAIAAHFEDEKWEREHPVDSLRKEKSSRVAQRRVH